MSHSLDSLIEKITVTLEQEQTHLFAQEVTDFDGVAVLLDDAVDGEMGVDCTHFVSEAL